MVLNIFHTSNKDVRDFVNSIVPFNRYTNSPIANFHGKLYNLPFNMNTFYQMWGVTTPEEAKAKIDEQKKDAVAALNGREPQNLEEQAICLVGQDIFYTLIKEYTEKQWGRKCTELPAFIIKRLPVRLVFDNNYFNDSYQCIPIGGYNRLINGLLESIETKTNIDFSKANIMSGKDSQRILCTQDASMNSLITSMANLTGAQYHSKLALRTHRTTRAMPSLITLPMMFLIPV